MSCCDSVERRASPEPALIDRSEPISLIYHDVAPPGERTGFCGIGADHYRLRPEVFARHLDLIEASGVAPARAGVAAPTPRPLYLTFDDGGCSAATRIAPMLGERGWPGHFFITTGLISDPAFVDPRQVRELRAAGHVVGSHSHTHRNMTRLPDASLRDEWTRSRRILEDLLGEAVTALSIPTGYASRRVLTAAAEAGYRHVFTSEPWRRPRRQAEATLHGRFSITAATPLKHVAALIELRSLAVIQDAAAWQARKAAKLLLGPAYERIRRAMLSRG
jgi:peptidoglycan/xylan/chitin deacetylase (PgdA/CDA1 family)